MYFVKWSEHISAGIKIPRTIIRLKIIHCAMYGISVTETSPLWMKIFHMELFSHTRILRKQQLLCIITPVLISAFHCCQMPWCFCLIEPRYSWAIWKASILHDYWRRDYRSCHASVPFVSRFYCLCHYLPLLAYGVETKRCTVTALILIRQAYSDLYAHSVHETSNEKWTHDCWLMFGTRLVLKGDIYVLPPNTSVIRSWCRLTQSKIFTALLRMNVLREQQMGSRRNTKTTG